MDNHTPTILFVIDIVFSSVGILADTLIVYSIFRFKKLRTPSNILLANLAIADLLSIVCLPANAIMLFYFFMEHMITYFCLINHATLAFHWAEVLFGTLLVVDWFAAAYYPEISRKFRNRYVLTIGCTWSIVLLLFIISSSLCLSGIIAYLHIAIFFITYFINVLFVVVLQISRIVQKCKTGSLTYPDALSGRLTIITVITFSYLMGVVHTGLTILGRNVGATYIVSVVCGFISLFTILASSVVTLGVLCWLDKDFRFYVFPCGSGDHERFENENSEYEDKGPTQVVPTNSSNHFISNNAI